MSEFVNMQKDGVKIKVSPLTVENHKQLKWEVIEEKPAAEEVRPEPVKVEASEGDAVSDAEAKAAEKKAKAEAKAAAKKAKAGSPAGK